MNNQVLETNINHLSIRAIVIKFVIATVIIATFLMLGWYLIPQQNPYVDEVLSFQGDRDRGEAIFAVNCASCHGFQGDGNVGPSLQNVTKHKSDKRIIRQVVSGKTPPMPKFQPSSKDMADLLTYLHELSIK